MFKNRALLGKTQLISINIQTNIKTGSRFLRKIPCQPRPLLVKRKLCPTFIKALLRPRSANPMKLNR